MKRKFLTPGVMAVLLAQEPVTGQSAAAVPPAGAQQPGAAPAEGTVKKRAPKTNLLDIARGRLPLMFVHSIRFKETAGNAETAKKYATSVGKVFDIKKGRNFGYVNDTFKPTQEDIAAAQKWADEASKHGGDKGALGDVIASYTPATADEAKAQAAAITAARSKQPGQAAQAPAQGTQPAQAAKGPTPPANQPGAGKKLVA